TQKPVAILVRFRDGGYVHRGRRAEPLGRDRLPAALKRGRGELRLGLYGGLARVRDAARVRYERDHFPGIRVREGRRVLRDRRVCIQGGGVSRARRHLSIL